MRLKKIIPALSLAMAIGCGAGAMEIENAAVADASKSILSVCGTLGEGKNNRAVAIYITRQADGTSMSENAAYFDSSTVDSSGIFEFTFKFAEKTDSYYINIKSGEELVSVPLYYVSTEDIKQFLIDLCDGRISDVLAGITEYKDMLGADVSVFQTDRDIVLLKKRISENAESIKKAALTTDFSQAVRVINDAGYEIGQLNKIASAITWSEVDDCIRDKKSVLKLDLTKYLKLSNQNITWVCSQLAGRGFDDADALRTEFNRLVALAGNAQSSSKPTGGSGGGGGGGTSGTAVREPIIVPEKITKENKDAEFSDIQSVQWAEEAILGLAERNVVAGVGDKKFEPDREVKREELVKMIVAAFGFKGTDNASAFIDADSGSWYSGYILTAQSNGIVNGIGDGIFGVGRAVTREDLAVILYRSAVKLGIKFNTSDGSFADDSDISDYAREAVECMSGHDIINGDGQHFMPKRTATRAETAKLIWEIVKLKEGKEE